MKTLKFCNEVMSVGISFQKEASELGKLVKLVTVLEWGTFNGWGTDLVDLTLLSSIWRGFMLLFRGSMMLIVCLVFLLKKDVREVGTPRFSILNKMHSKKYSLL